MGTYRDAEQYILSLSNLPRQEYLRDRRRCDLYLKRVQYLLDLLGNPEKKIPHYIHVTGTSGKGSVCTFLQAILHAAGKKVGSITSPHATWMTERWSIGERTMTKREFIQLIEMVKSALDEYIRQSPYDVPSYSELMVVLGLWYLAHQKIEWAVVEVGCGGRYDATNVIPWKDVAVITNIGTDHAHLIGPTKADIAKEKSGIIRSPCAVFTMETNPRLCHIIERACHKHKATLHQFHPRSRSHQLTVLRQQIHGSDFVYQEKTYHVRTHGKHQIANAALCIDIAQTLHIPDTAIARGLALARQPLRMEIVSIKPLIILDGAHNRDKMKTTVATVMNLKQRAPTTRLYVLIGFSRDKPWRQMLQQLATLGPHTLICTRNTMNPFRKTVHPHTMATYLAEHHIGHRVEMFLDPTTALGWTRNQLKKHDILLITGSLFLSGELRPLLTRQ